MENNILIVEDEKIVSLDLFTICKRNGYSPYVTSSGFEALEILKSTPINLALLDIMLEGPLTGLDVAAAISEKDIPVIFITATWNKEILLRTKLAEKSKYFIKPYDPDEVENEINKLMTRQSKTLAN